MKFEIKNRYSGEIQLTVEGDTFALALSGAVKKGANLSYANLSSADLYRADLSGANLSYANLSGANLSYANLSGANLSRADLSYANLSSADLSSADLSYANLSYANLSRANLYRANLSGANLSRANLSSADLSSANLSRADLSSADLSSAKNLHYQNCPQEGEMTVYKKLKDNIIAKLLIPKEAKRTSSIIGRKCRAEFAVVLELIKEGVSVDSGVSMHDEKTEYKVGSTINPDNYNEDPRLECTSGIHFFITKEEAEAY